MKRLMGWKRVFAVFLVCAAAPNGSAAQTFKILFTFDGGTDGGAPYYVSLTQGLDGKFYGDTSNPGTVFKITPGGTLKTMYTFCQQPLCSSPYAGIIQARNGRFYGTTNNGAGGVPNAGGTVFEITPAGKLTTLYTFCTQPNCVDGYSPVESLLQASDGNFYGTTAFGGSYAGNQQTGGTVFKITPAGVLTTLYSFCALPNCADGAVPWGGPGLVQGSNGNFYGTTQSGGANDGFSFGGTVFEITPAGELTTLYTFCAQPNCTDGCAPDAGMVQATDGNFYGTTYLGGANGAGTVFKLTPDGKLTTLYNFCEQPNCADGTYPFNGGLIQASDGNFYGTTSGGGVHGAGTIFAITAQGALTTLHNFCAQPNCADGASNAGLIQGTDGSFYGTTWGSGYTVGTVFSLNTGLSPFVKTVPTLGKVNATIRILGTNLTGATGVTFGGGARAAFTVLSSSEIKATVPTGATTDKVYVTTPSATLPSNVPFRVTPRITRVSPRTGPVGSLVSITGVSLTQTTGVTFAGVAANFTMNSDTQVTATVPAGATTGKIGISTLGGTATSSAAFVIE